MYCLIKSNFVLNILYKNVQLRKVLFYFSGSVLNAIISIRKRHNSLLNFHNRAKNYLQLLKNSKRYKPSIVFSLILDYHTLKTLLNVVNKIKKSNT